MSPYFTDIVFPGTLVITNYGTGPYLVVKVNGPCTCPRPNDLYDRKPANPHYHMDCCNPEDKRDKYYLGYYALDGDRICSVISNDEIRVIGHQEGYQAELCF